MTRKTYLRAGVPEIRGTEAQSMFTLLADSNALRDPGLEQYLKASRNHAVALSDWTITEMRKKNALVTSRESLRFVEQFRNQCYALKRTDLLLDDRVRSADDVASLIDYPASIDLRALAHAVRRVPPPAGLADHMQQIEAEASEFVGRLHAEVEDWEAQMVEAVAVFDSRDLAALRGPGDATIPHETMGKVFELLLFSTRDFMIRNQQKGGSEPMKVVDAMSMFGFRYSLCVLLYTLDWLRAGSRRGRTVKKRVNDVIDLQVAAVGTFFNGVLSADKKLQDVSRGARHLLRLWGAYVGPDWRPGPLAEQQGSDP